jgi:hypothetical protein
LNLDFAEVFDCQLGRTCPIEQTEGAKFWMRVMSELKNRGVNENTFFGSASFSSSSTISFLIAMTSLLREVWPVHTKIWTLSSSILHPNLSLPPQAAEALGSFV